MRNVLLSDYLNVQRAIIFDTHFDSRHRLDDLSLFGHRHHPPKARTNSSREEVVHWAIADGSTSAVSPPVTPALEREFRIDPIAFVTLGRFLRLDA